MAVTWAVSAGKHGIAREDAMNAIMNAYFVEAEFDEPRPPSIVRPHLFIGPPRKLGAPLLEVMAEVTPPGDVHIFHVMVARPKHLARMDKEDR